ncbi:MAG: fibronectin type III domain-containing protein [bacterium]
MKTLKKAEIIKFAALFTLLYFIAGCGGGKNQPAQSSTYGGMRNISVDFGRSGKGISRTIERKAATTVETPYLYQGCGDFQTWYEQYVYGSSATGTIPVVLEVLTSDVVTTIYEQPITFFTGGGYSDPFYLLASACALIDGETRTGTFEIKNVLAGNNRLLGADAYLPDEFLQVIGIVPTVVAGQWTEGVVINPTSTLVAWSALTWAGMNDKLLSDVNSSTLGSIQNAVDALYPEGVGYDCAPFCNYTDFSDIPSGATRTYIQQVLAQANLLGEENLPPSAVTLSTPTGATTSSLDLSWTQNADTDFASYKIYYAASSGVSQSSTLAQTITSQTTITSTVTGLSAGTTYYFVVYVCDTGDLCTVSNEVSGATLGENLPPAAVTLSAPSGATTISLDLSWTQNADTDFASYKVYYSTSSGVSQSSTLAETITSYPATTSTVTGLSAGITYYFVVYVCDTGGLCTASNEVSGATDQFPAAVTLSTPTGATTTSLDLSWTQNTDTDFTSYKIYYDTSSGITESSQFTTTIISQSTTSTTLTGLSAGTTYYFKVYVCDTGGLCTGSNEVSGATTAANQPPAAVTVSAPTNATTTSLVISWTQNTDSDFASYKIYYSTSSGVSESSTLSQTVTPYTDTAQAVTGLSAGTTYYFKVYVCDIGGLCTGSNEVSGTTLSPAASVATLAGAVGVAGYQDATGTSAQFNAPNGIAVDTSGTIYIADTNNHRIRKVTASGVVTTFAGSGTAGLADGTGTSAQFWSPVRVAVDSSGNVYVADLNNHSIRKITSVGDVTTFAGSGTNGFADGTGTSAQFTSPWGIAVDSAGNVYVADTGNHRIRKITPAGVVTTLAGSGTAGYADGTGASAQFNNPEGVAVDSSGNVYVADTTNERIRKITPAGDVTTLAGSGTQGFADGTGTSAQFFTPSGITIDSAGTLYVADVDNNRIREITPAGVVTTLAGAGTAGFADGAALSAQFQYPYGVAAYSSTLIYVADTYNYLIRTITR